MKHLICIALLNVTIMCCFAMEDPQQPTREIPSLFATCITYFRTRLDTANTEFTQVPVHDYSESSIKSYLYTLSQKRIHHPAMTISLTERHYTRPIPQNILEDITADKILPLDYLFYRHPPFGKCMNILAQCFCNSMNGIPYDDRAKKAEQILSMTAPSAFHPLIIRLINGTNSWTVPTARLNCFSGDIPLTRNESILDIQEAAQPESLLIAQNKRIIRLNINTHEYEDVTPQGNLHHFIALAPKRNFAVFAQNICNETDMSRRTFLFDLSKKHSFAIDEPSPIVHIAYDRKGLYGALGYQDNRIALFNSNTKHRVITFNEPDYNEEFLMIHTKRFGICSLLFSPDNTYLFAGSLDGTIHVWQNRPWVQSGLLNFFGNCAINCLCMNDTEELLAASSSSADEIRVYHNFTLIAWLTHTKPTALCFFPQSKLLASAGSDGKIKIWNTKSERCIHTLYDPNNPHPAYVTSLYITPDGHALIAGYNTGKISIWKASIIDQAKCID